MRLLTLLFTLLSVAYALHFEIPATSYQTEPVCIRDFVNEGQLVVVNVISDGAVGDGQMLNMYIRDSVGNEFRRKKDFAGEVRAAFTAPSSVAFDVCFENVATRGGVSMSRNLEIDIEAGSAARDWNTVQAAEKLKPIEVELRKVEELTDEIIDELNYLKAREERLRDTNESTNGRVRNFSVCVILLLIVLGAWQVNYLKNYFKAKHII